MQWWSVGLGADVVVGAVYVSIAVGIVRSLRQSGHWREYPLAVATAAIFASCAIAHLGHAAQVIAAPRSSTTRGDLVGGPLVVADVVIAATGLWYWSLRGRLSALARVGTPVDVRQRRRDALDIHDNVVQGLVMAKLSLELGETEAGMHALEETLEAARHLVTDLVTVGEDRIDLTAGDLRRFVAAGPH
jgi:signal transduction histidine kinase